MKGITTTRRELIALTSAVALGGLVPGGARAQPQMSLRRIPSSGELLPALGLGSTRPVEQISTAGPEPLTAVVRTLVEHGGRVVDTWPRNADNDAAFGRIVNAPDLRDKLFITTKIDRQGKDAGIAQFRDTQRLYGRETLDLAQIFSMIDLDTHWPSLEQWKATGAARYIGVTVAEERLHGDLERFLGRARPDFIQVNYSITEREAERRVLPTAADRGVAVLINRPFMNGAYFERLEGRELPDWAAELGCETWAQLALKYILAHPAVTCVLTETTRARHMAENARAASGPLPDEAARERMRQLIATV